jgi:hypothetical protein
VIGFSLLASSLVFYVDRRLVQDKTGLRLQESTPAVPAEAAATPEPATG